MQIFGDKPPLHTVRIAQSNLITTLRNKYCITTNNAANVNDNKITPAMALLCEYE